MPTQKAIKKCGEWLAYCLKIGWSRSSLDDLEKLWWENHDDNGRLRRHREELAVAKNEAFFEWQRLKK